MEKGEWVFPPLNGNRHEVDTSQIAPPRNLAFGMSQREQFFQYRVCVRERIEPASLSPKLILGSTTRAASIIFAMRCIPQSLFVDMSNHWSGLTSILPTLPVKVALMAPLLPHPGTSHCSSDSSLDRTFRVSWADVNGSRCFPLVIVALLISVFIAQDS